MTKPRTSPTATPQKAPKATKPVATFERTHANRPAAKRQEGSPSRGKANPKISNSKILKTAPGDQGAESPSSALGARITRRASDRLRAGSLWVYASDIESVELAGGSKDAPPAMLPVADNRGLLMGTALYSPTSQIALRMLSRETLDETGWIELLDARLRASIRRRRALLDDQTDACRLCFSEADELPGLVVDKYGELVILQLLARGVDSAAVRERCVRVLREELEPAAILERPDPRVRELEGLGAPNPAPLYLRGGETEAADAVALARTQFRLNGLLFQYDANSGQKTGAFLDQRSNYAATAEWARRLGATGRALDVCCYQGGFALHLAEYCRQVTGVDSSRASLEVAERNLEANRDRLGAEVDWVEADAFKILRDWSDTGERFDTIVLDPPAFAKSQRAVEGALRGYKELNLRALKMLNPGGLLVTFSCSHHVSWSDLEACVASAAVDAHRRVRLKERRGAAQDHPVVLNLPETEYLKCLVLEVE